MNSKAMIFECLDCKETYLADNLCDGYKCPECGGMVIEIGSLEGAEEAIEEMTNKVNKAKRNGLIRKYYQSDKGLGSNLPPKPEGPSINYVDLGSGKDHTIIITTNNPYIDKGKLVAEIMETLNNPRNPKEGECYVWKKRNPAKMP